MLGFEDKIIRSGDLIDCLRADASYSQRTKSMLLHFLEKAVFETPYHEQPLTANKLACMFLRSTRIKVHMRYADSEFTEQHWDEDAGVWNDGYHGITRYPVGDCIVESGSLFIPSQVGMKANYDVSFVVFEPRFSEKMREKWGKEYDSEGGK